MGLTDIIKKNPVTTGLSSLALAAALTVGCSTPRYETPQARRDATVAWVGSDLPALFGESSIAALNTTTGIAPVDSALTYENITRAAQAYNDLGALPAPTDTTERANQEGRMMNLAKLVQEGIRGSQAEVYLHLNCERPVGSQGLVPGEREYAGIGVMLPAQNVQGTRTTPQELAEMLDVLTSSPAAGTSHDPTAVARAEAVMRMIASARDGAYSPLPRRTGGLAREEDFAQAGYESLGRADEVGRLLATFGRLEYFGDEGARTGSNLLPADHAALQRGLSGNNASSYARHGDVVRGQLVIYKAPADQE